MASSVIGQLRVILGLDTAAFDKGLSDAEREMSRSTRKLEKFGQRVESIGKSISVGVTLPILAVGGAALGMAAKFESAMNRVEAATGASGRQLEALKQQAIDFGKDKNFTATAAESADVMEMLAKNGLNVQQILGGATEATLKFAAANGAEFAPSADAVTDILQQFGRDVSELPGIVDKMTGAMLVSKMGFDDYRLAIGQAGGVAGGTGQSFEDMNVVLAATSSLFASGSDAGTSYKTFLTTLPGKSKEAAAAIDQYGLSFYDAQGNLKSMGDIAQSLQDKLGGLNDQTKSKVLTTIFGTDAMRTAIGLMNQGADGLARIRAEIDKASAQTQMEARMKGWAGAMTQVKKAFEAAAISLGDSGILSALTKVLTLVAATIGAFADLPQPIQLAIGTMLGLTATIGPMLIVGGKALSMWAGLATLLIGRVVPATVATAAATTAAGGAASASAARFVLLRGAMAFLLTPWGLAIGAIAVAIGAIAMASETASERVDRLSKAAGDSSGAFAAMVEQARQARLAQEALAEANKKNTKDTKDLTAETDRLTAAMTRLGVATQWKTLKAAQANLSDARQRYDQAKARSDKLDAQASRASMGNAGEAARGQAYAARAELKEAKDLLKDVTTATEEAARNMRDGLKPPQVTVAPTASVGGGAPVNDSAGGSAGKGGGKSGPTKEELAARREELRLQAELNAAQMRGDTGTVQRLQDQLDLKQQIKSYEDAGLTAIEAKKAAEADLAAVASARRVAAQREIEDQKLSVDLDMARLAGDDELALKLERQQEIKDRILFFEQQLVDITDQKLRLEQATTMAMEQQAKVDSARAAGRAKWLAQDEAQRQIDLMKARGDSELAIRQAQRRFDIERRIEQLKAQGLTEGVARGQAENEDAEMEFARQQGEWRDVVNGGFRAALDGDLKGFAKNWLKDAAARGMEEGLNSVSDFLFSLFRQAFGQGASALGGGGGSGLFGTIMGGISAALGGGSASLGGVSASSQSYLDGIASTLGAGRFGGGPNADGTMSLTGFAQGTKGWMEPVGMAGVDRNVVAFRMSSNEEFAVRRKGEVGGPVGGSGDTHIHLEGAVMTSEEFWTKIEQGNAMAAESGAAKGAASVVEGNKRTYGRMLQAER